MKPALEIAKTGSTPSSSSATSAREGEDCDSDDVAQHARDGIGTLTLSGVGLAIVAETIETHAPRSFGAL